MKLLINYQEDGTITNFTCYPSKVRVVPTEHQILIAGTSIPRTFYTKWREYKVSPDKELMLGKFMIYHRKRNEELEDI